MLTEEERERVCVVLVRARNPNNIGAVARAMHDFGFRDLRLVSDYPVALNEARSAVDASAVLAGARACASVAEAVADCNLVVGTTAADKRASEHPLYTVADGSGFLRAALAGGGRVALLFGSEKTGLSRDELSHCNWIMTIPMYQTEGVRHASMNLGQAAAVCLYELVRNTSAPSQDIDFATAADLERLTKLLAEILDESGYPRRLNPADDEPLRRLVRRMHLNPADATTWMGMLRQVLWKLGRGDSTEDEVNQKFRSQ
jgi:TrmH family RNA methyltransferase